MKKVKRIVQLLLIVSAVLSFSMTAFAKAQIDPRWSYFTTVVGDLDISDSGKATILATVSANRSLVDEVKADCNLQRLEGSTWKTIKSWSAKSSSGAPHIVDFRKTYYVEKGYSYRIQVKSKAYKDGSVKETITSTFDYGYFN